MRLITIYIMPAIKWVDHSTYPTKKYCWDNFLVRELNLGFAMSSVVVPPLHHQYGLINQVQRGLLAIISRFKKACSYVHCTVDLTAMELSMVLCGQAPQKRMITQGPSLDSLMLERWWGVGVAGIIGCSKCLSYLFIYILNYLFIYLNTIYLFILEQFICSSFFHLFFHCFTHINSLTQPAGR